MILFLWYRNLNGIVYICLCEEKRTSSTLCFPRFTGRNNFYRQFIEMQHHNFVFVIKYKKKIWQRKMVVSIILNNIKFYIWTVHFSRCWYAQNIAQYSGKKNWFNARKTVKDSCFVHEPLRGLRGAIQKNLHF